MVLELAALVLRHQAQPLDGPQEVLADREYLIGHFYFLREAWPAAIARLKSLVDTYPLYSGADEALFFNEKSRLTEASGSNVFIVADGAVMTPRLQSGILPGVTRAALFELAKQTGAKVSEPNVLPQQLMAADEVFLTNSLIEVMPVTVVAGQKVGDGRPGPTTRRLMQAYAQVVQAETL